MKSNAGLIAAEESDIGYLLSLLHFLGSLRRGTNTRSYYLYSAVVLVLILVFLISQIASVMTLGSEDVDKVTLAVCVGATVFVTIFKTVNNLHVEESLLQVVDQVRSDYARFVKDEDLPEIVRTSRVLRYLSKSYLVFGGITAVFWMICVASNGERSADSLPFVSSFPFDVSTFPGFEVAYLFHTFIMFYVYLLNLIPDLIFVNTVVQACLQLRILSRNLSQLNSSSSLTTQSDPESKTLEVNEGEDDKVYQDLIKCVQHHQIIIRNVRTFESTCTNVLLLQSTSLSSVMCILLYHVTKQANFFESIKFVAYFVLMLTETLILCLFGDLLISDSEAVLFAVYSSSWLTASPKFKKSIYVVMAQSRNPITVSAGKFYVFSKQTFISILQLTYSFFAVLRSINAE